MNLLNRLLGVVGLNLRRTSYAPMGRAAPGTAAGAEMMIGNRPLIVPTDSVLRRLYRENPDYMSELGRMARQVHETYPDMVAVDVGANFGDTAAIMRSGCPAPIICIDGDPAHGGVLAENAIRIGALTVGCIAAKRQDPATRAPASTRARDSTPRRSVADSTRGVTTTSCTSAASAKWPA